MVLELRSSNILESQQPSRKFSTSAPQNAPRPQNQFHQPHKFEIFQCISLFPLTLIFGSLGYLSSRKHEEWKLRIQTKQIFFCSHSQIERRWSRSLLILIFCVWLKVTEKVRENQPKIIEKQSCTIEYIWILLVDVVSVFLKYFLPSLWPRR